VLDGFLARIRKTVAPLRRPSGHGPDSHSAGGMNKHTVAAMEEGHEKHNGLLWRATE
jgi:hypothetical protein